MCTPRQLIIRDKIVGAARSNGSQQITYESEWLGYLPFGVYHWVDCGKQRISDAFPSDWTRADLEALEQQGVLRLLSIWKDPHDEFHERVVYELRL